MKNRENKVYQAAIQNIEEKFRPCPEAVIFGYTKLLHMGEVALKTLLAGDENKDLEGVRAVFEKYQLDTGLIRSGLSMLFKQIYIKGCDDNHCREMTFFLETEVKESDSAVIVEKAINLSRIPVDRLFKLGQKMDGVFSYLASQKDNTPSTTSEVELKVSAPSVDNKAEKTDSSNKEEDKTEQKTSLIQLSEHYRGVHTALLNVVKGQEQAVLKFVQGCYQGELLKKTERGGNPRSYFFFLGPPGVGKTLLAQTAANHFGRPYKVFNMSGYSDHQAHAELIGTAKHYQGAEEGSLVRFVRENPESIIVFDEIEKAHINTIRLFLQILGMGKLQNVYQGTDTDFSDTIIIFTSNVGKELYSDSSINLSTLPEKVVLDAIRSERDGDGRQVLPNEICSRIASGNMIMFNHLPIKYIVDIIKDGFDRIVDGVREEFGCNVSYSQSLPLLFLYTMGTGMDARIATSQSGLFIKDEIYELMRHADKNPKSIYLDADWDNIDSALKTLFVNEEANEVLIFSKEESLPNLDRERKDVKLYITDDIVKAREYLKNDLTLVVVDPFCGKRSSNANVLSIADYDTDGVELFHDIVETETGLPIYIYSKEDTISKTDIRTFMQEGASGVIDINDRILKELADEIYMEKKSTSFTGQGWVIGFNSKQIVDGDNVNILFYNLKKRQALDEEGRESILSETDRPDIKFDDVIGAKNAKEELRYFIEYLKNPRKFRLNGGKPPKGILLYGPPGTGKTMLAKAMAGESEVAFLETSAAEFMNSYVGESEANVRRLFKRAKKYAPAIIFIDEIDAIGKKRTGASSAQTRESVLNTLLTEMDGFSSDNKKPVFVLAATNYGVEESDEGIARLDDALVRRFDNIIKVDLPDNNERETYIKLITGKKGISIKDDVIKNVASRTTGQSLAILNNVIELAHRNAVKLQKEVEGSDLLTSLEEYLHGEKKEHSPEYYKKVAIHETGHAVVSHISGDTPSYITIESRGNFGGYMQHANQEDVPEYTKENLLGRIRTSLAGRAAEEVFFGKEASLNTGASSDLSYASNLAFQIICSFGMEEGEMVTLSRQEIMQSSLAEKYISKVNAILSEQMEETKKIIIQNKDLIQKVAEELEKKNRLTGEEFVELVK